LKKNDTAIFASGMACEDTSKQLKCKHSLNLTGLPAKQKHLFFKIPEMAERQKPRMFAKLEKFIELLVEKTLSTETS